MRERERRSATSAVLWGRNCPGRDGAGPISKCERARVRSAYCAAHPSTCNQTSKRREHGGQRMLMVACFLASAWCVPARKKGDDGRGNTIAAGKSISAWDRQNVEKRSRFQTLSDRVGSHIAPVRLLDVPQRRKTYEPGRSSPYATCGRRCRSCGVNDPARSLRQARPTSRSRHSGTALHRRSSVMN